MGLVWARGKSIAVRRKIQLAGQRLLGGRTMEGEARTKANTEVLDSPE